MIKVVDLHKKFHDQVVLNGVNLSIDEGHTLAGQAEIRRRHAAVHDDELVLGHRVHRAVRHLDVPDVARRHVEGP